ncbi:MAG: hypothetical protein WC438_03540 [Candidatus Pacearchaeota archaeon]
MMESIDQQKLEQILEELNRKGISKKYISSIGKDISSRRRYHPLFSGDFKEIQEVHQMDCFFSTPEKPILATYGLANCLGVLAYDPLKKIAFLGHSDAFSYKYKGEDKLGHPSVNAHVSRFFWDLRDRKDNYLLDAWIVIGSNPDNKAIETTENTFKDLNNSPYFSGVRIRKLERLNVKDDGSIGIDSRTGRLFSYDPKLNPLPRQEGFWSQVKLF